jgi:hypothetical protein
VLTRNEWLRDLWCQEQFVETLWDRAFWTNSSLGSIRFFLSSWSFRCPKFLTRSRLGIWSFVLASRGTRDHVDCRLGGLSLTILSQHVRDRIAVPEALLFVGCSSRWAFVRLRLI